MAWRAKDATVLVVDVGRSMHEAFASSDDGKKVSKAEVAVEVAQNIVRHKLFFNPKHEVGVVLFGTSETSNDLQSDGYENVFVCRDRKIDVPDVNALKCLSGVPSSGQDADAVNALIVALDLMIKRTNGLKYDKTIRLVTDAASATAGDPDLLECVKQLEATGTKLSVTVLGSGSMGAWEGLAGASPHVDVVPLVDLARESSYCVKPVEQRAKVRLPLVVSPEMQVPVGIYSKTTRVNFPTLKKQSKTAAAIPEDNRRTDKVIMDRTYHVTDDPDGEEVKKEDRVKGHKYGSSIVPMSEYDEAALMYSCERTLTALGFAPAASIGPEHSMHATDAVAADKGDRWAHCAFESMVEAMLEDSRVLIARYCYRKDSQPRMVALIPVKGPQSQASHMILQYLPFMEDIREWTAASLPEPSEEQQKAVSGLLDSLSLQAPAEKLGAERAELLRPEDTHNPALSRFYSFLAQRATDPSAKLAPASSGAAAVIMGPPAVVAANLAEALPENERVRLKTLFGLEKVEKPAAGGHRGAVKRFWREAIAEKRKDSAVMLGEVDTKKIKVDAFTSAKKGEKDEDDDRKVGVKGEGSQGEGGDAVGMATAVEPPPRVHIGSVHPERDFERWLAARRTGGVDTVGPAVEQMCDVILRFADEGEEFHGKALSCLAALRRGCVREGEAAGFNEFMRKLRLKLTKRQALLWERASKDPGLGLITDTEVVTSTVSSAEARAFLDGTDGASASAASASASAAGVAVPATALSERDLEAMIE